MTWLYRALRLAPKDGKVLSSTSSSAGGVVGVGSNNLNRQRRRQLTSSPFSDIPQGTTMSKQGELLRYGVPDLESSARALLETSEHFLTPQELGESRRKAEELVREGGLGRKLHAMLLERAEQKDNWLADWWLDRAYLKYRDSVVINSNPGITFPNQKFPPGGSFAHLDYAARLVAGFLDMKEILDRGCFPIEMLGKSPMDMEQYYSLIGTTRVPGRNGDSLSLNPNSKHIVVLHNNNFFKVRVYDRQGRLPLSEDSILGCLRYVVDKSAGMETGPGIGVLTADDRDAWSEAYEILREDNEAVLKEVETALFTLSLDPPRFSASDSVDLDSRNMEHAVHGAGLGDCTANRWFDKAFQIYVTETGESGLCYEHSPAEAVVLMVMADHVLHCANGGNKFQPEASSAGSDVEPPAVLEFKNPHRVRDNINRAKDNISKAISDLEMRVLNFRHFGKGFVKSQKFSPDSFVQMAFQLAFYRIHGEPGCCYESGGLRMFRRGRTDVIRSSTPVSLRFAKAFTDDDGTSYSRRLEALTAALKAHSAYAKRTVQGQGLDRHLLGLALVAKEAGMEAPALLSDPAWTRSTRHRLSTSQVSGRHPVACGFAPLVSDGYGACYNIGEHDFRVACSSHVSCAETSAEDFREQLETAMLDMHDCMLAKDNKAKL